MRRRRHREVAGGRRHREVGLGHLGAAGQGCALALRPSDDELLLLQAGAVPALDRHLDRAGHEVAAAGHPSLVGPHPAVERLGVVREDVGGAVLEAEQVARRLLPRTRARGPAVPEAGPAHLGTTEGDAAQVADRVHHDLRVVGARLDAEVAVTDRVLEEVERERRQRGERLGSPGGDAERVTFPVEQRGAQAEGQREVVRAESERLAGVVRRSEGRAVGGTRLADLLPGGELCRCRGPVLQQRDELLATGTCCHVEAREVQVLLHGRGDAGLVLAVEVVGRAAGVGGVGGRGPCGAESHGGARRRDGGQAQDAPARDASRRGVLRWDAVVHRITRRGRRRGP